MNLTEDFMQDLFRHLTHSNVILKGGVVKKHSENFDTHGEFSVPVDIEPWLHYIKLDNSEINYSSILEFAYPQEPPLSQDDLCQKLIKDSETWTLKIDKCHVLDKRLYIFLNRGHAIKEYLLNQPKYDENFMLNSHKSNIFISHDNYDLEDITFCRLRHFVDIARNLIKLSGYIIDDNEESADHHHKLHVTTKSPMKQKEFVNILIAPVLNDKTGLKVTEMNSSNYLSKRIMDMQLIAQHKYGLRVKNEEQWRIFLDQLGHAAVIFDLMQNKPSHPVTISAVDNSSGCSKGISFILYNGARLSAILKKYNEAMESGLYPKLSSIQDVDLSNINDSDEWILMFNFMMCYGSVLKKCVDLSSRDCPISPHQLCSYLSGFAGRFSMYYRRIRILLEPRKHLLPLVEARIHFLLAIQNVLHHALTILNIVPVTQM